MMELVPHLSCQSGFVLGQNCETCLQRGGFIANDMSVSLYYPGEKITPHIKLKFASAIQRLKIGRGFLITFKKADMAEQVSIE